MQYRNKFGTVEILGDSVFNNKTIGISMSGGADSTLLCFLLANTIKEKNLNIQIQPFNGYDIWCSGDSAGLPEIIKYLQNKFPTVKLHWPISVVFNTKGIKEKGLDKNSYIRPLSEKLAKNKIIDVLVNALCLGPPTEIQQSFNLRSDGGSWGIFRRPGHELWEEIEKFSNTPKAPFVGIDKRFIIQCYYDFNEQDLLQKTNSCTEPIGNCGECWWCQEKKWALNNVSSL
tara:strand:- start:735 stop:1424 length:690 start_codon:yes stop_codon:yes gene_type:complete